MQSSVLFVSRNYKARIITRDQKLQGGEKRISKMII